MLYRILEAHGGSLPDGVVCCFANTGKEMEETLRFVKRCGDEWGVKITWLEYMEGDPRWREVTFETASRNGEPFEALVGRKRYLPNPVTRFCTIEMKIRVIAQWLASIGFEGSKSELENASLVGIRADEPRRAKKIPRERTPLVAAGVTAKEVGEFWASHGFDLELPNRNGKTIHGNCDLCFLKGAKQVQSLIDEKPERALWWAKVEGMVQSSGQATGDGARFRKDRPGYRQMYEYALAQKDWIGHDAIDDSIGCFCGD